VDYYSSLYLTVQAKQAKHAIVVTVLVSLDQDAGQVTLMIVEVEVVATVVYA
jgi:hypothetical protein